MSEAIWTYGGVHLLLTLIFFAIDWRTRSRIQACTETLIVWFVPGFGLIMLLLFKFWCRVLRLEQGHSPELSVNGEAFFRGTKMADEVIPLNDAFLVDNPQQKRALLASLWVRNAAVPCNQATLGTFDFRLGSGMRISEHTRYTISIMF